MFCFRSSDDTRRAVIFSLVPTGAVLIGSAALCQDHKYKLFLDVSFNGLWIYLIGLNLSCSDYSCTKLGSAWTLVLFGVGRWVYFIHVDLNYINWFILFSCHISSARLCIVLGLQTRRRHDFLPNLFILIYTFLGFDYTDTSIALGLYGTNLVLALASVPLLKSRNLKGVCLWIVFNWLNLNIFSSHAIRSLSPWLLLPPLLLSTRSTRLQVSLFNLLDGTVNRYIYSIICLGAWLIPYALWTGFYAFLGYSANQLNKTPKFD